jgi:ABC-type glutathione transport system ATPase component
VQALEGVDLTLAAGSTLALVGPSGSGKSTLARCLAGLEAPDGGDIRLNGRSIVGLAAREQRAVRTQVQLIFQDSATALPPRLTAAEIVEEPLVILRRGTGPERRRRVHALFERVGLAASLERRRPFELSGGQRQRLAIARALAVEPKLLVLDEAQAGLDAESQAQIVDLLSKLQAASAVGYLLVSHDLGLVAAVADEVAVLHEGRIVERGEVAAVLEAPQHAVTRALVAAIPAWPA